MFNVKEQIIWAFPSIANIVHFEKVKKRNTEQLERLLNMNSAAYPDYLKAFYKTKTGNELNLDHPKRLSEKIQWRKLYDHDSPYASLSDKHAVHA